MKFKQGEIILEQGDITNLEVDAIVNAANSALLPGGGVCGAIYEKGGYEIFEECRNIGSCMEGSAVITHGGHLPAKFVIHAVGPSGSDPQRKEKLSGAIRASLRLCDQYNLKSVAFPAISTGIFSYPVPEASHVMIETAAHYLKGTTKIQKVIFCLYDILVFKEFSRQLSLAANSFHKMI